MQNVLDLKAQHPQPAPLPAEAPALELESEPNTDTSEAVPAIAEQPVDTDALAAAMLASVQLPTTVSWTAHHPLRGDARRKHFLLSAGLVLIGVVVSLLQSSVVPFLVILAGVFALELREHWGEPVQVGIDQQVITINGHPYDHASFASFHIHRMPDETLELSLRSGRKYLPNIRLPLGEQDPTELHAVLTQYIPEQEHRIPFVEYLLRKPRR